MAQNDIEDRMVERRLPPQLDGPRGLNRREARPMPAEYREALQNYHKAIEQLNH